MSEKIFAEGFIFKRPNEKAPDFIKGHLSIVIAEAIPFLQKHAKGGWVNLDIKESKSGKLYMDLNTWEKEKAPAEKTKAQENFEKMSEPVVEYPKDDIKPEDMPF